MGKPAAAKRPVFGRRRPTGNTPASVAKPGWDCTIIRQGTTTPALGRFIQADAIVPKPGNPQSLNRYAYGYNNPVKYNDPIGHFSEKQLINWFGENWRDLFNESWITILLAAELGDALLYNLNGDSPLTAIFVLDGADLMGWDLGSGKPSERKVTDLMSLQKQSDSDVLALYRSPAGNPKGGPSKFPGEGVNLFYSTREYIHITGNTTKSTLTLPENWFVGPQNSVYATGHFAGFDLGLSDFLDLGDKALKTATAIYAAKKIGKELGKKAVEAVGGWYALATLAVDVAEWTQWDTTYYVSSGHNLPPRSIPTPPSE